MDRMPQALRRVVLLGAAFLGAIAAACVSDEPSPSLASAPDGASPLPVEAGVPDAVDAVDAGARFCLEHAAATVCEDFDEGDALTASWTVTGREDFSPEYFSFDRTSAASAPASGHLVIPRPDGGTRGFAASQPLGIPSTVDVQMTVRRSTEFATLFSIAWQDGSFINFYSSGLVRVGDDYTNVNGCTERADPAFVLVTAHVNLAAKIVRYEIADTLCYEGAFPGAAGFAGKSVFALTDAIVNTNPRSGVETRWDNIVVDAK